MKKPSKGKGERVVSFVGMKWRYKIGRRFVRLISPDEKNLSFAIEKICPNWDNLDKDQRPAITPAMICNEILSIYKERAIIIVSAGIK